MILISWKASLNVLSWKNGGQPDDLLLQKPILRPHLGLDWKYPLWNRTHPGLDIALQWRIFRFLRRAWSSTFRWVLQSSFSWKYIRFLIGVKLFLAIMTFSKLISILTSAGLVVSVLKVSWWIANVIFYKLLWTFSKTTNTCYRGFSMNYYH